MGCEIRYYDLRERCPEYKVTATDLANGIDLRLVSRLSDVHRGSRIY